jgi:hypothetical protein
VFVMLRAVSPAAGRMVAAVPVTLLSLFIGLLWLIGLACGEERRQYVMKISDQMMRAVSSIWQSALPPESSSNRPSALDDADAG